MAYNPNAIWGSKQKKYEYRPDNESAPEEKSFLKKHPLLFFSVGLVALLLIAVSLYYLITPRSGPNVNLSFSKPDQVLAGDPFQVTLSISNLAGTVVLKNAELSITLPQGLSFVGEPADQRVIDEHIGDISSADANQKEYMLIATDGSASTKHISAKLLYSTLQTPNANYESDADTDLVIGGSVVSLDFTTPSNIVSGQNFDLAINYRNNTNHDVQNALISLQYPSSYTMVKSNVTSTDPNKARWEIPVIPANATGTVIVTGNIIGPSNAFYAMTGTLSRAVGGNLYPTAAQAANIEVTDPPLGLSVDLANGANQIIHAGDGLSYTLSYKNTSNITFSGVMIKATLVGAMFDTKTLETAGSFDSRSNTITWYAATTPSLQAIAPGSSGSVSFGLRLKSSFPIRLPSDKNYTLKVNAKIISPTVLPDTAGSDTAYAVTAENKISGKITLTSKAYVREPDSSIKNIGPYPPKVDKATQYTIHWAITNDAADMKNVTVSAYLQSGSTFTGILKSSVSSTPVYDPSTGLVSWTIPFVPATTGIINHPIEAVFQISNTPAVNQVGEAIVLVSPTNLKATDVFTDEMIDETVSAITTQLPDDPSISGKNGIVTQ